MPLTETQIQETQERLLREWRPRALDEVVDHRQQMRTRIQQLTEYQHRTQAQDVELEDAVLEVTTLDDLVADRYREASRDRARTAALDPANREAGAATGRQATRTDSVARQTEGRFRYRSTAPWADLAAVDQPGMPRFESTSGWRARAHDVLEAVEGVPDASREMLARMIDNPNESHAASTVVAIASPAYLRSFSDWIRNPQFAARGFDHEQQDAWARVSRYTDYGGLTSLSGWYVRTAMSTTTIAAALPYVLDPTVILTSAGQANPYRQLARRETTTSNAWQGVTSLGTTANWISEGTTASETSPTAGQLQVFPEKAVVWAFGSLESLEDTAITEALPGMVADARDRLEESAFTTGAGHGSTQPLGILAAVATGASDVTAVGTAARAATDLNPLLEQVGARWRKGSSDRLAWISNINWLNKYRLTAKFSGATEALVDDSGSQPRIWGVPWYESTTFATASSAGTRPFMLGAWDQFLVVDRLPTTMIYDPLLKSTGNAQLPTGQAGYYYFFRTSSTVTQPTTGSGGPFRILRLT